MKDWHFAIVVVLYLLVTNIVALIRKGVGPMSFRVYSADPKNHGTFAITMSLLGTIVGGGMFLGVGQIGYEAGVLGYIIGATYVAGMALFGAFAPKIVAVMDANQADTMVDVLEKVFSRRMAIQFSLVCFVMYFFLLAGQLVALYSFASYIAPLLQFQWLPWVLVGFGVVSMLLYPVIGGLRKDISTDVIQMLFILLGAFIIGWRVFDPNAVYTTWASLTDKQIAGTGYGALFLVGVILFTPGLFLVRMDMWQRVRACKEPKRILSAFVWAGIGTFAFFALFTSVGMAAFAKKTGSPTTATLDFINQEFSDPRLFGIIIGGLFAAVLTSADTFTNNLSVLIARVVCPKSWLGRGQDNRADGRLLLVSRVAAVIGVLGAVAIGVWAKDFVDLLVAALSLLLIYLPAVLATFVPRWRNEKTAFWSSLFGLVLFALAFAFWNRKLALVPGVLGSTTAFVVAYAFSNKKKAIETAKP
jgi:SSS family solute:Na+ symporter/sodium/proline symporter